TPRPVVDRVAYATRHGTAEAQLYRPSARGPHPGVVVCLGVVPFGVEHPQVPRLGEALARAGLAVLLHWSPAMRDLRIEPEDADDIGSAFEALVARPEIDPARSGLIGTCVGGAAALIAASRPRIRDRVRFVFAYAPYASMWTFARDIASASRARDGTREPWDVDQLTRRVYVRSVTSLVEGDERAALRDACAERRERACVEARSETAKAILPLLTALDVAGADAALRRLPAPLRERLDAMSPLTHLGGIRAPLVAIVHDRDDGVIPVSESRALRDVLAGRDGVRYTELTAFRHLDPAKSGASPLALAREFVRFAGAVYPMVRASTAP
ncbi:MAG TPA: hypothetical protein VFM93_11580, partial [Candidatus Limnocylindria bacterium]|nr:hypothetical protein [Candidatus Limnocylindria bacterium]